MTLSQKQHKSGRNRTLWKQWATTDAGVITEASHFQLPLLLGRHFNDQAYLQQTRKVTWLGFSSTFKTTEVTSWFTGENKNKLINK